MDALYFLKGDIEQHIHLSLFFAATGAILWVLEDPCPRLDALPSPSSQPEVPRCQRCWVFC